MDRKKAEARYRALRNMTVARGCTQNEADIAKRLADTLAKKFGFADTPVTQSWRPDFDVRWERAERRAATKFRWEYRRCGKQNCHCARGGRGHGPYKYGKVRVGNKVNSIYLGT